MKKLLRTDPRFRLCMHYASYSRARRHEKPVGQKSKGKGVEPGFGVVMVELMLRKHALVKGCQSLTMLANRWQALADEQIKRFPDAHTFVFLFDDETNVPQAKGETQRKRRKQGDSLSPEELETLGPYRYLCNPNPEEFDRRVKSLFEAEAMARQRAGRTTVSAFEVFLAKHMRTRGMREDEFEFATRCVVAGAYAELGPGRRILVDRGVWRDSFERRVETDPYEGGQEAWQSVARSFAQTSARNLLRDSGSLGSQEAEAQLGDQAGRAWILIDRWGVRKLGAMDGEHLVGEVRDRALRDQRSEFLLTQNLRLM